MDLQPETYERALAGLQEGCCEGRLKNRTDSILLFAELSDAGIDQEEFCSVRNHLNRVLRHSRAIRRALRRGDEQIGKIKEALGPKPPTPLEESAIKSARPGLLIKRLPSWKRLKRTWRLEPCD